MNIIDKQVDLAGKFRILVENNNEVIMFKFSAEPTEGQIEVELSNYLANKQQIINNRTQEIDAQIASLQAQKDLLQ